LPPNLDGKEGVDGSSPSEGFPGCRMVADYGIASRGAAGRSARCGNEMKTGRAKLECVSPVWASDEAAVRRRRRTSTARKRSPISPWPTGAALTGGPSTQAARARLARRSRSVRTRGTHLDARPGRGAHRLAGLARARFVRLRPGCYTVRHVQTELRARQLGRQSSSTRPMRWLFAATLRSGSPRMAPRRSTEGRVDGPDRAELAASWEVIQDWNSAASSPPTRPFSSCLGQRWLKILGVRAPQRGHSSMGMK
jgi:hypothetical protein